MLVNCKACGKEIAKGAKCPACGKDQRNFFMKHKILTGIMAIVILGGIGSAMGGSNPATDPAPAVDAATTTKSTTPAAPAPVEVKKPIVPTEYISALKKAQTYGDIMNMSKKGIYDQLTSEYGEKFSKEAAQYAIDNAKIDYNANALKKAQTYQKTMSMSPSAIYNQLTSEYGEKFTPSEAKYAKDNLK